MRKVWQKWQLDGLRDLYPHYDTTLVSRILQVSEDALRGKAHELHIGKSEAFMRDLRVTSLKRIESTRFKKGQVSWNKGMVCPVVPTEGMKRTMFKKGGKPHNTSYDGAISVLTDERGLPFKKIRVAENCWELLSRYNYRKFVGEIPAGCVIRFRDGDAMNCNPENLECVTRTLHMLLNSKHGYTREIAEVKEVICYINNEIKEPTNEK